MGKPRWRVVLVAVALAVSACGDGGTADTTAASDEPDALDPNEIEIPDNYLACLYLPGIVAVERNNIAEALRALPATVEPVELGAEEAFALINSLREEEEIVDYDAEVVGQIDDLVDFVGTSGDPIQVSLALRAADIPASPIHAIGLATHWGFGPGDVPVPVGGSLPDPGDEFGGTYVGVVDSGIDDSALPDWMLGRQNVIYVHYDEEDREVIPAEIPLASHGTFVASIIRRIAPSFGVSLAKAHVVSGISYSRWPHDDHDPEFSVSNELDVANAVIRLTQRGLTYEALNLSLGAYICDPSTDAQLVTLAGVLSSWSGGDIIAAAGNQTLRLPFWPAALTNVKAIAASNLGGQNVDWSQGGATPISYVPAISPLEAAPGVRLVGLRGGTAADGSSLVAWSGSSFATAVASALTALNQSLTTDYAQVPRLSYIGPNNSVITN